MCCGDDVVARGRGYHLHYTIRYHLLLSPVPAFHPGGAEDQELNSLAASVPGSIWDIGLD